MRRVVSLVALVALVSLSAVMSEPTSVDGSGPPPQDAEPPPLQVLSPGFVGTLAEPLPVNVVFVGYEPGPGPTDIDVDAVLDVQSHLSLGFHRMPMFSGRLEPTYTAIVPSFSVTFADEGFEDELFDHLADIGTRADPTEPQLDYNDDDNASRQIDETLEIDAPSVEEWLAGNLSSLDIAPGEPTVFFINWFGRDDFQHHVYTKFGTPEPDTGEDLGELDTHKMIAWGGSPPDRGEPTQRVWFHDLSAGPDHTTVNWNLTDADVDGDGIPDYRLPPVWEYGNSTGYRSFEDLSGDLGKVLRYVVVDTLLAPSPLYPPAISPPELPSQIGVDITRVSAPGSPPSLIDGDFIADRLERLQPWNTFTVDDHSSRGYDGRLADVHRCWLSGESDPTGIGTSCYGDRGDGFSAFDLWFYLTDHWMQFVDRDGDHSIPTLVFEVPDAESAERFIAVAERSYTDGSQSHVLSYATPELQEAGVGQSSTLVHEIGHHVGLSHPHDGLDFDLVEGEGEVEAVLTQFSATGDFHFVWVGGQSATLMSYFRHVDAFGQFDLDNMGRWMTAAYLNHANVVLEQILASPRASRAHGALLVADFHASQAVGAFRVNDYQSAATLAKRGYDHLLATAAELRIPIEPQARPADMTSRSPQRFFADPIPPVNSDQRDAPLAPPVHRTTVDPSDLADLTDLTGLSEATWIPAG